jgi:hypothetical protein
MPRRVDEEERPIGGIEDIRFKRMIIYEQIGFFTEFALNIAIILTVF